METLQQNIQDLIDEVLKIVEVRMFNKFDIIIVNVKSQKVRLTNMLPDSSIASILMSLNQIGEGAGLSDVGASSGAGGESGVSLSEALLQQENEISKEVRRRANLTIEKLRLQVSALLNVDEELDINQICNGNSSVRLLFLLAIYVWLIDRLQIVHRQGSLQVHQGRARTNSQRAKSTPCEENSSQEEEDASGDGAGNLTFPFFLSYSFS